MGVNYSDIIERMRWAGKLKNDSAVASVLGVTPQALSNYKKRGLMPSRLVIKFANIYGFSVDWLITGEGDICKPSHARENDASYSKGFSAGGAKEGLTSEEASYMVKLIEIMRSSDQKASQTIRYSIDSLIKSIEDEKTDE